MKNSDSDFARKMAEALEEAGIVNDVPESDPNPLGAAQQAFYVCEGRVCADDWREYYASLSEDQVPASHREWKLSRLCYRALRHPGMKEDLREAVAYGWGYFAANLPAALRRF